MDVKEGLEFFKKACIKDALTFREWNPVSQEMDKQHVERVMVL